MIYVIYAVWIVGVSMAESVFWSRHRGINPGGLTIGNAHLWLVLSRAGLWGMVWVLYDWKAAIFMILSFSFFHDGIYYTGRNLLDGNIYKAHFFDTSTNSTALITQNFITRTFFAILGCLVFFFD